MFRGMIGWNYTGPSHTWDKEEKAEAVAKIAALNAGWTAEQMRLILTER